jgi:hypothetical protein
VKVDPTDVVLFGITAPSEPVEVILTTNPAATGGQPYTPCVELNDGSDPPCTPVVQHACQNKQQPALFGDPAVRLNAVIHATQWHGTASICDGDQGAALDQAARLIVAALDGGCVAQQLAESHPARLRRPDAVRR